MGKSFAPNYASIFLHFWETDFINKNSLKPSLWIRYIDDIFGVWVHGIDSFMEFIQRLNNFYECINITHVYSATNIDFLDVTIFKHSDFYLTRKFSTKIYFKETFTGHLIHSKSLHSKRFKISVIKAQFYRILRKCSFKVDFDNAINRLSKVLFSQGYNRRLIRNIKYEVLHTSGFYTFSKLSLGFFKCNTCNFCCKCLPSEFAFDNNFQQFRILSYISCQSVNVIFSIYCSLCGPISVRFSKAPLFHSIDCILTTIRSKPLDPLSSHFCYSNHSINNLFFQGLQSFNKQNSGFYPSKEILRWIMRLNTFTYPGLDSDIFYPKTFRYIVPFSSSNSRHSFEIRNFLSKRFNVKISPSYSSFPNFKQLLCRSKFD